MLIDQLRTAVEETVREFQKYHADFLSENDIQSLLFAELRHGLSNLRYDIGHIEHRFNQIHAINPVKTEYQLNPIGLGPRVDIAVLSEVQNPNYNLWRQPCRIAIEIKLWQPGGPYLDPWDDVKKLKSYQQARNSLGLPFTGIAVLFVHPVAERWRKGMPNAIVPSPGFPSDGIALHLVTVTPLDWKRFSISLATSVSSLIGESQESSETSSSACSSASPDEILPGQ
jgi:hypothetical protein